MAHSKKTLQKTCMMLRAFIASYKAMQVSERHCIYEVHVLRHNEFMVLEKCIYFALGHSILPDQHGQIVDFYCTLLRPFEIENYLKQCDRYGIK